MKRYPEVTIDTIDKLADIAMALNTLYQLYGEPTGMNVQDGIHTDRPYVQVQPDTLDVVAPPHEWEWVNLDGRRYPYEASVMHGPVRFIALFDEEEAAFWMGDADFPEED